MNSLDLVLRRHAEVPAGHLQRRPHQSLDWGPAYPVTLSFGGVVPPREVGAGPPASWSCSTGSGAQGFGGFTPINEVNADRHNYAVYAGLEADLTDKFSAGLTGRYED